MGQLTESEFADIVNDVAASWSRAERISIVGFGFTVTFRSQSGRSTWNSDMTFDQETWHYTYSDNPHYPGASSWAFGDAVQKRIRQTIRSH